MNPPRLLSLLSAIESVLLMSDFSIGPGRPQRYVNFQKGIARMTFPDASGCITLQNFTLADGQICVKAEYLWSASGVRTYRSIYPTGENFDWQGASFKLAEGWMDGPPEGSVSSSPERLQAAV